jgi:hypothetical protein
MNGYYEDIDEDLDELDDESDDESIAERRRRRRSRARGGGYTRSRRGGYAPQQTDRATVSQGQLEVALTNVGDDVKKLNASVAALERDAGASIKKLRYEYRRELQNFAMMSAIFPLITKGKTVTVQPTTGDPVKVAVESDSLLTTLLPFLLFSQSAAPDGYSGDQGASGGMGMGMGGNMGLLLAVALLSGDESKSK